MSEKKQASNAWIAAGHFIKAGILSPLLFAIFIVMPFLFIFPWPTQEFASVVISVILICAIWAGAVYSAKKIAKKYVVKESDKIINWSVMYYIIFNVLDRTSRVLKPGGMTTVDKIFTVCVVVGLVVFYFVSKKYIKNDEEMVIQ